MSTPIDTLDLASGEDAPLDDAEIARRIEQASKLVQDFAVDTAQPALDAVLALAEGVDVAASARRARMVAEQVTRQSELLDGEIARFLSLPTGD